MARLLQRRLDFLIRRSLRKEGCRNPAAFFSWGAVCEVELNHLMPWIDKIWALHPYFPELISKKRTLQSAELL